MTRGKIVSPKDTRRVESRDHAPDPPSMRHRIHLPVLQWIGLPLMVVPPALALAGVFDPHDVHHERRVGALVVEVTAPDRGRLNRNLELEVDVYNGGARALDPEIAISPEYLAGAQSIEMVPSPERAWATRLRDLAPGERRRVEVDWLGDRGGVQRGVLRISDGEEHEARIELQTLIFP